MYSNKVGYVTERYKPWPDLRSRRCLAIKNSSSTPIARLTTFELAVKNNVKQLACDIDRIYNNIRVNKLQIKNIHFPFTWQKLLRGERGIDNLNENWLRN